MTIKTRRRVTKKDWNILLEMVQKANRAELEDIRTVVENEIRVSETVIAEGRERPGKSHLLERYGGV